MLAWTCLILAFPFFGFAINSLVGWRFKRHVHLVACPAIGLSALAAGVVLWRVLHGASLNVNLWEWIPVGDFRATFGLQVDQLSALMAFTVSFVSFLIHIYSIGYMHGDIGYHRYFCFLNLFVFCMLVLVLANNFLLLLFGWEGVGLCSYALIGHYYERRSASDAGKKAFITCRVGDYGLLLGIMLLFATLGTVDFQEVFDHIHHLSPALLSIAALLIFAGAVGKSAQVPLYVWLPDAMEGPTPVSALIHAATMVTAGAYLVARCFPIFSSAPMAGQVGASIGAFTAFFAATMAVTNNDLKRVLAYSTISQLGYMVFAASLGACAAGIFHLMTHAYFKALLFLCAGSVMHAMAGELDMRRMGGLFKYMRITALTMIVGSLALSGIPPFAGFWSKDEILLEAYAGGHRVIWLLGVAAAFLTAFYMFRLIFMTFFGGERIDPEVKKHLHESPPVMTVPLMILAAFSVVVGMLPLPSAEGWISVPKFLEPVFRHGHQGAHHLAHVPEEQLMAVSVLVAVCGVLLAALMYLLRTDLPKKVAQVFRPIYLMLVNRYWVDEFYMWLVVVPLRDFISTWFLWRFLDSLVVDGAVNGSAAAIRGGSGLLRRLQTGQVQNYALSMLLGAVGLLFWYVILR